MIRDITNTSELLKISPKPAEAYKGVPLVNLIAYSLYWLHKWEVRPTFESLTVLSWRLFPGSFSLVGFPQFPDAARTTRSILQGQPKYRNVLTGTPTRGYHLNQRGEEVALSLSRSLGVPDSHGTALGLMPSPTILPEHAERRTINPMKEVEGARNSRLFQKWQTSSVSEKDVIHVHSLLGIFDHTPSKERQRIFKELVTSAQQVNDEELVRFLDSIREMFPNVFANREK